MKHQFAGRNTRLHASALLVILTFGLSMFGVPASASAQSRRNNGRGITVFTDPEFRGESATFRDDIADLRSYGLNDKVSSIEVPNGESWEICQDLNYGNRCQVLSGSVSNLRDMGWNDRISSLRRVGNTFGNNMGNRRGNGIGYGNGNRARNSESLLFYDRTGFRGSSTLVNSDASDLSFIGRPSSVEVRGGTWELCDRSGRCATVTQSVSDLSQLGLRDRLRSANLLDDRDNRGVGRVRRNRNSGGYWP
jgi:hypothetical protein